VKASKRGIYLSLVAIALLVITISPLLDSGFFYDDIQNSIFCSPTANSSGITSGQMFRQIIRQTINEGRTHFLAYAYLFAIHGITDQNVYLYKSIILLLLGSNVILFIYFLNLFTNSVTLSLLTLSFFPILFQFRDYHDPILGFTGLLPIVVAEIVLSLIFLVKYLIKQKRLFFLLSWGFFLVAILSYELTYPLFVLHLWVIYALSEDRKFVNAIKTATPFIIVSLVAVGSFVIVKSLNPGYYAGTSVNLNKSVAVTFSKQIVAALPLSYYLNDPLRIFSHGLGSVGRHVGIGAILIAVGYPVLLYELFQGAKGSLEGWEEISGRKVAFTAVLGALLLAVPAAVVGVSQKYQQDLSSRGWGVGYIPVYMSYFGVAVLGGILLLFVFRKVMRFPAGLRLPLLVVGIVLCTGGAMINYNDNGIVVRNLNFLWKYPRSLITEAVANGLFAELPANAKMFIDDKYCWEGQCYYHGDGLAYFFYRALAKKDLFQTICFDGKCIANVLRHGISGNEKDVNCENEDLFYLRYDSLWEGTGYAILGRVKSISFGNAGRLGDAYSDSVLVYVKIPRFGEEVWGYYPAVEVRITGRQRGAGPDYFGALLKPGDSALLALGKTWRLYRISLDGKEVDLSSLTIGVGRALPAGS
jgi:hypothetical protein